MIVLVNFNIYTVLNIKLAFDHVFRFKSRWHLDRWGLSLLTLIYSVSTLQLIVSVFVVIIFVVAPILTFSQQHMRYGRVLFQS